MPNLGYRFAIPSFLRGMAQALDLSGGGAAITLDRSSLSPAQQDARALSADWRMVGDDLRTAMQRVRAEANLVRGAARDGAG